jgi:Glutamine cyclotransferase
VLACELREESRNGSMLIVLDDNSKQLARYRLAESLDLIDSIPVRGLNSPVGIASSHSAPGHLYLSDGRNRLFSMELSSGLVEDSYLQIRDKTGEPADIGIGAMQQAGDYLVAANTKSANELLLIDTSTSRLAGRVDLSQLFDYMNELLQQERLEAVQRGKCVSAVAFDSEQKTLFAAGPDWPFVFELKFPERTFKRKPGSKPRESAGDK